VEPTPDNLETLRANVAAADVANVVVAPVAAGRVAGLRELFVRGEKSAVNSLFAQSCYAQVTAVLRVPVVPLDDLVDGTADVVKLDVEGAELDVLEGMPRLLRARHAVLIAEWHPKLQRLAGYEPDALPRWLIERGFKLQAVSHVGVRALDAADVTALGKRLERHRKPVELVATRPHAQ
jgi:FkbM family methyltransferase